MSEMEMALMAPVKLFVKPATKFPVAKAVTLDPREATFSWIRQGTKGETALQGYGLKQTVCLQTSFVHGGEEISVMGAGQDLVIFEEVAVPFTEEDNSISVRLLAQIFFTGQVAFNRGLSSSSGTGICASSLSQLDRSQCHSTCCGCYEAHAVAPVSGTGAAGDEKDSEKRSSASVVPFERTDDDAAENRRLETWSEQKWLLR
ncbi:hypothetical protein JRQ81_012256 [Phrynocephalus forsythii]|uniref:Uncharacterized protein n=1 Tax=Phrynocephalus forsythii TaxID=171643 RepID=A0A9Q1AQ12_9SAUR|nr:hypothetical protein JRQ81_012256 [Phrynocephalus forsythii]